jgi:hypothetical protein
MQCDDYSPKDNDLIEDIMGKTFILDDVEFPITQCCEEITTFHGNLFPIEYRLESITIECGHKIDLYSLEKIEIMINKVWQKVIRLDVIDLPFPLNLVDYS